MVAIASPRPRGARKNGSDSTTTAAPARPSAGPGFDSYPYIVIEDVWPEIDGGRWPVKREVGDGVEVWADVYKEGHDLLRARVLYRREDEAEWRSAPMLPIGNDRWHGRFTVTDNARYRYTVEAFTDVFGSWLADLEKRVAASQDVTSELLEGQRLVRQALGRAHGADRERLMELLIWWRVAGDPQGTKASSLAQDGFTAEELAGMSAQERSQAGRVRWLAAQGLSRAEIAQSLGKDEDAVWTALRPVEAKAPADGLAVVRSAELRDLMERLPDLSDATRYDRELELYVDRERARFAAWYEIFPRSQGTDPTRSATFREAAARLPAIADMGFDVVYMTPIHPIGTTNRKGRNNSLTAGPDDPGSPYAIGSPDGGHEAIAPELGTLDDFLYFQQRSHELGMELAMDFAIQVSPDHPWAAEHPDWFYRRPDGTIKYAENPPKKYEDIYPLNFRSPDWKNLWAALRDVVLLWAERGVRIFRVDNPHTKPLAFWTWLIREVQDRYPDTIFLAEAFTRPKVMRVLGKAGFTQSYTYFTWRNTKGELTEYLTELTQSPMREYYRGNFFVNTPDILPRILQEGGRPAFRQRLVLAATLSSVYGIYSGYELCENVPRGQDSEYYLDSEMYQHKVWDWDRPGNIVEDVRAINRIRRENPALHEYDNLRFAPTDNDQVIAYWKATSDLANVVLVVVNLDYAWVHSSWISLPLAEWGLAADQRFEVHDLLADARYTWQGGRAWVRLDPHEQPAHVFRVELPRAV